MLLWRRDLAMRSADGSSDLRVEVLARTFFFDSSDELVGFASEDIF
jgi:hypothetical protein